MSDFAANPATGGEDTGPVTIYDIQAAEDSKVRLRALPRLTRQALRLAWAAGPRDFMISTLLQVIGGGGIVLLLLLGQQGLQALLDALQQGESLAAVAPWAIAIAAIAGIQSFVTAVQRERQQVLGELMQRHVEESVLEVAAAVDLLAFETPAFHNRARAADGPGFGTKRSQFTSPRPHNTRQVDGGLITPTTSWAAFVA